MRVRVRGWDPPIALWVPWNGRTIDDDDEKDDHMTMESEPKERERENRPSACRTGPGLVSIFSLSVLALSRVEY